MLNVTVVGDLILDRYLIGDASKLNPEQPGVVIRVDERKTPAFRCWSIPPAHVAGQTTARSR